MKASQFLCLLIQALFVFEYAGVEGIKCYLCSYTWTQTEVGKECIEGTDKTIECATRPCTLTKRYTETWGPRVQSFSRGCTEGLVDGCRYDSPTSNHYTCKTVCNTELCNSGPGKTPSRLNKGTYLVADQVLTYILLLAFSLLCLPK